MGALARPDALARERAVYRYDYLYRTIDDALRYSHMTRPDAGEHVAFDLRAGRAYYLRHTR